MHGSHAVWPASSWKVPAAQLSQVPCSVAGCTVPGLHSVAFVAPVEQNEPAGQPMQSCSLIITGRRASWWRPDGQGSAAEAPSAQ